MATTDSRRNGAKSDESSPFDDGRNGRRGVQLHLYGQKADEEGAEAKKLADELAHDAGHAVEASDEKHKQASRARTRMIETEDALESHLRRPTDAKLLKWLRWALLLLGDIVGIAGAALLLGELPANAFMQAVSAGASAVTLGAAGREVRYVHAARVRKKDGKDLTKAERTHQNWFNGSDSQASIVKIVMLVCAAGLILICGGVYALRDVAEGPEAALAFACFSLALGLASFYNSFDTADDVAEHLDARFVRLKKLDKIAADARTLPVIRYHAGADSEAASNRSANENAGKAAAAGAESDPFRVQAYPVDPDDEEGLL